MSITTQIMLAGNLVDDVTLHYTPSGQPVAQFRVASTERYHDQQSGEWRDGNTTFVTCKVWRKPAEFAAESLTKGSRVIVAGRLEQRTYETDQGEKRTVYEIDVDELGASLKYATVTITKASRTSNTATAPAADGWTGGAMGGGTPPF